MANYHVNEAAKKALDDGLTLEQAKSKLDIWGVMDFIRYKMEKEAGPEKVKRMDAERYKRSAKKWNYIINCVNGREKPTIPLTESEQFDYERMAAEKDAFEEQSQADVKSGKAKRFCPFTIENVETEW